MKSKDSKHTDLTVNCPQCNHQVDFIFGSDGSWGLKVKTATDCLVLTEQCRVFCCVDCRGIYRELDKKIW